MKILITPHPFLKKTVKPVTSWTPKLQKQLEQMIVLLKQSHDPQGMGLAATQVGIDKRFFITLDKENIQVFINPKIIKTSTKMLSDKYKNNKKHPLEGCLSIPKFWGFVDRPYSITLSFQYLQGLTLKAVSKTFNGLDAISIQHERDHLDGILFTDHILKQGGTIYKETKKGLIPLNS
ncbi:peptide deformylase [Patescibacteria group bacterium]|nr:peptide deformylase [Patescibacteria group bacterium]